MRNIVILVLIIIGLAILRSLISDVSRAVSKAMNKTAGADKSSKPNPSSATKTGRLVRDPHSGAYVDEAGAVRADIDGQTFFFESDASRDAFLRARSKA